MANHRPKSLSELNNVYDKAMRAERAIKEGSSLLSVPDAKDTPQNENIFKELEDKAAQAEKNQVFDPDITNIANDFLKRYAQTEKPKPAPKEIKRPAPSIQSVYHSAVKPKAEEKQGISLNMNENPALNIDAPAIPLHKPAATIPAAQPEPAPKAETPAEEIAEAAPEVPVVTAPQTVVTETPSVAQDIPADAVATEKPQVRKAASAPAVVHTPSRRIRITSTERNELMEEYMKVMSDDDYDDDEEYKKPKFSFFKKKKKYEEELDTEPVAELYEEPAEEDETHNDEVPVVPFDNSDVRYTDEYSEPVSEEASAPQEQMNIYDYIEADFDYSEEDEYSGDEEDGILDVSLADNIKPQEDAEEPIEESQEATEEETAAELSEESQEVVEEAVEETAEEIVMPEEAEESEETSQPTDENAEEICKDAPPSDMVFEDVFSVSDQAMRSHTGGNWEEVFGKADDTAAEDIVEAPEEEYPEYTDEEAEEETVQPVEEYESEEKNSEEYAEEEPAYKESKKNLPLKILTVVLAVLCIIGAAATLMISVLLDVDSGNLVSDRYRAFSVSEDLTELGLEKGTLVIAENIYAHMDDLYVYTDETSAYHFGKVVSSITNLSGDYLYLTKNNTDSLLINRDNSLGVVIATYDGIGLMLSAICQNYILISGALLLLAVAMIVCFILISRRKTYINEPVKEVTEETDDSDDDSTDSDGTDADDSEDEDVEYYTDYDTDGIEEGLFSSI